MINPRIGLLLRDSSKSVQVGRVINPKIFPRPPKVIAFFDNDEHHHSELQRRFRNVGIVTQA